MKNIYFFILGLSFFCGCSAYHSNKDVQSVDTVMSPGMSITVQNPNGVLTITAGKGFERNYSWAGGTRTAVLWPRKERWDGSLGIYYPGPGNHWKEHDGITRGILEEGRLNFNSLDALEEYLSSYEEKENLIYNDNGLCVFWCKSDGAGGTMTVFAWQLLINYEKPKSLPGSNNDKIKIVTLSGPV